MRIALDAMGGDHAPKVNVDGAIEAARRYSYYLLLVGEERSIREELKGYGDLSPRLSIVHSSEVIAMDEQPAVACRQKRDSSIMVATRLVKAGEADALISAGNTGAVMTSALLILGRIKGISRPAIATPIPNLEGTWSLLLDVGANVDCKPQHLLQFAIMGSVYAKYIFNKPKPRVGLLSIGAERSKGNQLTHEAYELLRRSSLNFIGNVEGGDIVNGRVDVIVCDGFVGNVILKFGEGLAETMYLLLKKELSKSILTRLGAFLAIPAFKNFIKRVDYTEVGGAPLLGVNGVCIICHGRSSSKAIVNAVRLAGEVVSQMINREIEKEIKSCTAGGRE